MTTVPNENEKEFLREILGANQMLPGSGQRTFTLDGNRNEIVLYQRFDTENIDLNNFAMAIAAFVGELNRWRESLRDWTGSARETSNTSELSPEELMRRGMIVRA